MSTMTRTAHGLSTPRGQDWRTRAACLDHDPEIWHPVGVDRGERLSPVAAEQVSRAVTICRGCPVRDECLDQALDAREPHGIWGGTTPAQRARHVRLRSA